MEKQLAIKGHSTRGKEVIELFEMMGGKNKYYYKCNEIRVGFTIGSDGSICRVTYNLYDEFRVFTLEEFLEKYPFKVGDKVMDGYGDSLTIKSMRWSTDCETIVYDFEDSVIVLAAEDLFEYNNLIHKRTHEDVIFDSIIWHLRNSVNNGKQNLSGGECEDYFREIVKKNNENKMKNVLAELLEHIKTTPNEELEREFEEIEEWSNVGPTVEEFRTFCECVNKKHKYPTSFNECKALLQLQDSIVGGQSGYEWRLIGYFQQLLMCRDAYWKIAGEQMGLGKPWKPDWDNLSTNHEFIKIDKGCFTYSSRVLVFPTEEMRDAFYENFDYLINACKELL